MTAEFRADDVAGFEDKLWCQWCGGNWIVVDSFFRGSIEWLCDPCYDAKHSSTVPWEP